MNACRADFDGPGLPERPLPMQREARKRPNQRLVPTVRRASLRSARRPAAHPQIVGRKSAAASILTDM